MTGADAALRACTVNQIAAELLWRASKPTTSRPWRPFYLTHGEALALARHAVDNALHEAHDRGELVTADARGCEMLGGAALLVLEKIEPGRWRVEITVVSHGRSPDVTVTEREPASATTGPGPYGTRSPASLCWDCGRLVSEHAPGDVCNADLRGLAREVRQQLRDADRDRDVASATILSRGPVGDVLRSDGAVVVIKGGNYVELFMQWAERNGLLTRGKAIVDLADGESVSADSVGAADAYDEDRQGGGT